MNYKIFYNPDALGYEIHEVYKNTVELQNGQFQIEVLTRHHSAYRTLDDALKALSYYTNNKELIDLFPNILFKR